MVYSSSVVRPCRVSERQHLTVGLEACSHTAREDTIIVKMGIKAHSFGQLVLNEINGVAHVNTHGKCGKGRCVDERESLIEKFRSCIPCHLANRSVKWALLSVFTKIVGPSSPFPTSERCGERFYTLSTWQAVNLKHTLLSCLNSSVF